MTAENIPAKNNDEYTGSLVVFVLDAGGALPISGAKIYIYKAGEKKGEPVATLTSGENGKTEPLYLPTPSSSTENGGPPYALYNIIVESEGYRTFKSCDIPIYPFVMSIQPVYMVPMPLGAAAVKNDGAITGGLHT